MNLRSFSSERLGSISLIINALNALQTQKKNGKQLILLNVYENYVNIGSKKKSSKAVMRYYGIKFRWFVIFKFSFV